MNFQSKRKTKKTKVKFTQPQSEILENKVAPNWRDVYVPRDEELETLKQA